LFQFRCSHGRFVGTIYAAIAVICGAIFVFARIQAAQEQRYRSPRCFPPVRGFDFLLVPCYFAVLLADHRGDPPSTPAPSFAFTFKGRTNRVPKTFHQMGHMASLRAKLSQLLAGVLGRRIEVKRAAEVRIGTAAVEADSRDNASAARAGWPEKRYAFPTF
jgi:hypothetical protein